jgi:hypothetical protein
MSGVADTSCKDQPALTTSEGGTGVSTLATHGMLVGEGTGPVNALTAMSAGQIPIGQASADPVGTTVGGDATLAANGSLIVTKTGGVSFGPYATSARGQLPGTATNDNADAGDIGEFLSNTASGVSLMNGTPAQVGTLSLTAGDWDIWGSVIFSPAATTTSASIIGAVSLTSASANSIASPCFVQVSYAGTAGANQNLPMAPCRVTVATTTSVFVNIDAFFSVSTATGSGTIFARRVR